MCKLFVGREHDEFDDRYDRQDDGQHDHNEYRCASSGSTSLTASRHKCDDVVENWSEYHQGEYKGYSVRNADEGCDSQMAAFKLQHKGQNIQVLRVGETILEQVVVSEVVGCDVDWWGYLWFTDPTIASN